MVWLKRAIVLDLDDTEDHDCADLLPEYQLIEIYHEPAAYFARLTKPREDTDDRHGYEAAA